MAPYLSVWLLLILTNLPVAFALGLISFAWLIIEGQPLISVPQRLISGLDSFPLLAVPLFILAGSLMNTAGITDRIFGFARVLVGHITGGLGHVNVIASLIFSGMSGSAVADAGGLGQLEIKAMRRAGFDDAFAGGITGASCIIGPLVPPSIPMILYAVIANVSVGALFLAGVMPGLLSAAALMVMVWLIARRRNYAKDPRANFGQIWRAFRSAFLALLTPVIIIGGIFGGVFTPTEAAAAAAFYALFLGVVVYRELSLADLVRTFREVTLTTSVVGLILSGATLFNWVLARENVPQLVAQTLMGMSDDPTTILLLINLLLLVLGMFVDPLAIMILLVPVFTTITAQLGIDPVHFGVVMVFNLMIGLLTPPMGVGLFVVSRVSGMPLETVVRGILPFLVPLVLVLLLITLVPELVLALPHWVGLG